MPYIELLESTLLTCVTFTCKSKSVSLSFFSAPPWIQLVYLSKIQPSPLTLSRRNIPIAPQEKLTNTQNLFSTLRHHFSFLSLILSQTLELLMSSSFYLSLFLSFFSARGTQKIMKKTSEDTFNEDFRRTKEISELQRYIYQSLKHLQICEEAQQLL